MCVKQHVKKEFNGAYKGRPQLWDTFLFGSQKKEMLERENITKLTSLLLFPLSLSLLLLLFYEIKIFEGIS